MTNIFFFQEASPWGVWWIWKSMLAENVGFNACKVRILSCLFAINFYSGWLRLVISELIPFHNGLPRLLSLYASHHSPETRSSLCRRGNFEDIQGEQSWTCLGDYVGLFFSFYVFLRRWLCQDGLTLQQKWSAVALYRSRFRPERICSQNNPHIFN